MTFRKFKYIDLLIFTFLAVLTEAVMVFLQKNVRLDFYVSFATLIFIIASIRWGSISVVCYMAAGIPAIILNPIGDLTILGLLTSILYYVIANAFIVIPILLYGKRDRDWIMKKGIRVVIYILLSHLTLSIGKGLAIWIIDKEIMGAVQFLLSTLLNLVICIILSLIFNWRKTELLCDMKQYLIRQHQESMEEDVWKTK